MLPASLPLIRLPAPPALRYGSGRSSFEKPILGLFIRFADHFSPLKGRRQRWQRWRQTQTSQNEPGVEIICLLPLREKVPAGG